MGDPGGEPSACVHVHACVRAFMCVASMCTCVCMSVKCRPHAPVSCGFRGGLQAVFSHRLGLPSHLAPLGGRDVHHTSGECFDTWQGPGLLYREFTKRLGRGNIPDQGWAGVCPSLPKEGEQALVGDPFTLAMGGTSSGRSAVSRRPRCSSTSALPSRLHPYTTVEGNL